MTVEQPKDKETCEEKTVGFGWGKFWIIGGFWSGGLALIFGLIMGRATEIIPNRGIALLIAVLGIGSAIGLLIRRKFALHLINLTLILSVLGGVMSFTEGSAGSIIKGIAALPIAFLWFRYFRNRKEWFR